MKKDVQASSAPFGGFWFLRERRPAGPATVFQSKPDASGRRLEIDFGCEVDKNRARQFCKRLNEAANATAFFLSITAMQVKVKQFGNLRIIDIQGREEPASLDYFIKSA